MNGSSTARKEGPEEAICLLEEFPDIWAEKGPPAWLITMHP
jgi:hypothetical protein